MGYQAILAVLLALPGVYYPKGQEPETPQEREARLLVVAEAIHLESKRAVCEDEDTSCRRVWPGSRRELESLLITLAFHETRFAYNVHVGKCRENECDSVRSPGGGVVHRARGLWQVHATGLVGRALWDQMLGAEISPTRANARGAVLVAAASRSRCARIVKGGWLSPTLAGYAGVQSCEWSGARSREATFHKISRLLTAKSAPPKG